MRLGNFTYLFKEGARNVLHNKLMSLACIGVLIACLLLIGSAALFTVNVNSVVHYVEQQNEFIAYISKSMGTVDIETLALAIRGNDNVMDVTFMTKDEALEARKQQTDPEFSGIFDGLEGADNPLMDRFVIRIDDTSLLDETVEEIRRLDGIYKVNAATDVAQILTDLKSGVTFGGAMVVVILIVVSVVIITNTIKLTVFNRRKEINIMKYVGATDMFIRFPFVVEGMLIGLLAACLAFLLMGISYTYLLQWVRENYAEQLAVVYNNVIEFWDIALYMFTGFAALGIIIGVVGSGIFVRKYLKV